MYQQVPGYSFTACEHRNPTPLCQWVQLAHSPDFVGKLPKTKSLPACDSSQSSTLQLGSSRPAVYTTDSSPTAAHIYSPKVMSTKFAILTCVLCNFIVFAGTHFHTQDQFAYKTCMDKNSNNNYCKVLVWGR